MTIIFLILFISYVAFAIFFILSTWKTSSRLQRQLTVAFFVLLPTWDFVLGLLVYYPACLFIPKTAIYETAETEGIYYEGDYKNYVMDLSSVAEPNNYLILFVREDFDKGYKYAESLVTKYGEVGKAYSERRRIPSIVYRCTALSIDPRKPDYLPIRCVPVNNVRSGYTVKSTQVTLGLAELRSVKIFDRSQGRLMAEHREVARRLTDLPFFTWVKWWDGVLPVVSCPEISRYYDFQYDVLKVKK